MKKLYNRNKDVELYHKQKLENDRKKSREREASQSPHKANRGEDDAASPSPAPNLTNKKDSQSERSDEKGESKLDELDMIQEFKKREEQMQQDIILK